LIKLNKNDESNRGGQKKFTLKLEAADLEQNCTDSILLHICQSLESKY